MDPLVTSQVGDPAPKSDKGVNVSDDTFKTLKSFRVFRRFRTLSSEESALNTLLGRSLRSEFRAEVKQPEPSEITSQLWPPVSLMD